MSTEADATGTPAATTQTTTQEPPAQQPTAQSAKPVGITSEQLKERLDETRAKAARDTLAGVAKDLGVSVDEAKAIIAKAKAAEDANKSDVERLTAEKAALAARAAELDEYKGAVEIRAKAELGLLSEDQRNAVLSLAGEHPAKQLKAIETLRPTWQSIEQARKAAEDAAAEARRLAEEAKKAADAAAAAPAPKPPLAAPANTAPAATAPPPAAADVANVLATYEALEAANPMRAAHFFNNNYAAISAAKKARASA